MRGPTRGALVILVLSMLVLLLWQLRQESQQLLDNQRQLGLAYSSQLANHLSLNMVLKASAGQALLQPHVLPPSNPNELEELLHTLRGVFPTLRSLAWINGQGRIIADSHAPTEDALYLGELLARGRSDSFFYTFSANDNGRIYLLLRHNPDSAASGFWVLRLTNQALTSWLHEHHQSPHQWQLEDRNVQRVIASNMPQTLSGSSVAPPVTAENLDQSLLQTPLKGSDWQLRALFNERKVRAQQLPQQASKLLLFILCATLTLLALYRLLNEQRNLHALNTASRRSLQQAASVLGAIEERVLVTDSNGQLQYLNPQAEAMFGLSNNEAHDWHLLKLLPRLDPLLLHDTALHNDLGPDLVEIQQNGVAHLYDISRSDLSEDNKRTGFVWVLRDVTEEQHASHVLQETRRRYQDIFDGTGTALCVLDLAELQRYLQQQQLRSMTSLQRWLDEDPQHHSELCQRLRLTETNQVALQLLGVDSNQQAWQYLFNSGPLRPDGFRMQLISALLSGSGQLEMERQILTPQGYERHLWLLLRLPESIDDLQAVTLSISDITNRKRIETSLIERERFWSDVVSAVPDTIYVHDIAGKRVMYSNNHLGPQLGYSKAEIQQLGERLWEKILHPDDVELYQRMRNIQQVQGNGLLMQFELRWRHRDGSWHWFDIREQALSRDAKGRVSRLIGVAKDITDQITHSESLRTSEQRYRLLAESISDVIFSTDAQLQLNYVRPSVMPVLGYDSEWALTNGFQSLATNPRQLSGFYALLDRVRNALGDPQRLAELRAEFLPQLFVFDALRADGQKIPVELRLVPMWDDSGRFEGLLGVGRDISLQRRAEKDLRMAATVFEHSTAAILVTDPAGYIVQVNNAFSRVSGYSSKQILDQLPSMLTADTQQASHLAYVIKQLNQQGSWEGEVWLKRRSGEKFPAWVGITAVKDDEGDLVSYVCFFSDISERKASEQRIHRLAYYDALTQLPNRTLFQDRLHSALQHGERHQEWVVLMFLDLDRFKPINDSLGHAAGDRMLKEVAVRLCACVDSDDTVARMGGDEFTLLLQSQAQREGALTRAIHVGEQILASLAQPFILEGREFFVTASIGIALSPQDGNELSQLMKNADTAMYHAKERGKNNFQFYQADMNACALQRLELESDLRHALEQGEFKLYYQPQFSGDGKRLTGAEALLRWQHPQRGLVPPNDFIPVLEELGLVVQVGDWVLRESCRQLAEWHGAKIRVPKISVNLSARQFAEGDLDQRIAEILQHSGIPAGCLELELTESILMEDVANAMQTLSSLKKLGVFIAIDDFGTGYSSLNYLKQFPIDVLKIDRSFVDVLPHGEQDGQIARAIIAMAHSLNLTVIAEGVETLAQLDFLRGHDCDEVQGFLLGRPMPAHQFTALFTGTALFMLS
ncbi:sensor domain-containing protein [Pseudomonas anguilliseptica]|uniref:cyclic-guanylate-specific phosphodiesterase n=1 Tax=Pseudomonas anguilliseptica TaxID=53406 RepID=A0A1H4RBZ8_PSEAG|nr:EAL domain-containing protein [Pseudomonas anguilliseptica]SEC29397.1 diguanylate cyclase/phosphodiesterase with PAS/PAC sensor(s) [Pseudomonas anguilliseptica]